MLWEEIRQAFQSAAWRISGRTDKHMLVGDAKVPFPSILACEEVIGPVDSAFELAYREHKQNHARSRRLGGLPRFCARRA